MSRLGGELQPYEQAEVFSELIFGPISRTWDRDSIRLTFEDVFFDNSPQSLLSEHISLIRWYLLDWI